MLASARGAEAGVRGYSFHFKGSFRYLHFVGYRISRFAVLIITAFPPREKRTMVIQARSLQHRFSRLLKQAEELPFTLLRFERR